MYLVMDRCRKCGAAVRLRRPESAPRTLCKTCKAAKAARPKKRRAPKQGD